LPYFSLASIINSNNSNYTVIYYGNQPTTYVQFHIFGVDSSDNLDDLLESELLLDIILIVDGADPCKDPAQVHIRLVVLVVKELLDTHLALTDRRVTCLEAFCILVLDEMLQRVLQIGVLHEKGLEIGLI
jgi:hypothetical protein